MIAQGSAFAPPQPSARFESESLDWKGETGTKYTARNPKNTAELDVVYRNHFGITRTSMLMDFLALVRRDAKVLEVGTSIGSQLDAFRAVGFGDLHGVDLCVDGMRGNPFPHAAADACALPFRTGSFDLVFTSGTLMHVPPRKRRDAVKELLRVSKRWIFGTEYYSPKPHVYRWANGLLPPIWVEDLAAVYAREAHVRTHKFKLFHPKDGMPYSVFLLEKV